MSEPVREPTVQGLTCPSCGGTLTVATGLRVVECSYCETPLLAVSEIGVRRWSVRPELDAPRAREVARQWLSKGWNRDRRLRREARQGEALLAFLPFFRMQADAVGFALGTEVRRRTVGSGKHRRTETYEVDVERSVEKSFDRTYPALDVAEWGVQKIDLHNDRLVPYDLDSLRDLGMVFPPTGSEVEIREAVRNQIVSSAEPGRGLKKVRFRFFETLRERFSVIYYPLWIIRYRFEGRSYQILIDAEDGSLVYGKAPGNDLYRAMTMVLSQAVALFIATTIVRLVGANLGGLAAMGAVVVGALWWGWSKFRHGGVVVEGTGVGHEDSVPEMLSHLELKGDMGDFMSGVTGDLMGDLMSGRPPRWGPW